MKKFLILFTIGLLGLMQGNGIKAENIEHTVVRGETLKSIAAKYNVSQSAITSLNPDAAQFVYVGMVLNIPLSSATPTASGQTATYSSATADSGTKSKPETQKKTKNKQKGKAEYVAEAETAFRNGKYKKAAKLYSKAIKIENSLTLKFNRGLAYYNGGKYKPAISDFWDVKYSSSADEELKEKADKLMTDAKALQAERDEKRAQAWSTVLGVTLGIMGAALDAASYSTYGYSSGYVAPATYVPYTMLYTEPVFTTPIYPTATWDTNVPVGWDANYAGGYYDAGTYDYGGTYDTGGTVEKSREEQRRDRLNATIGENCMTCKGSGKCHACNGTKVAHGLGLTYACTICNQRGDCDVCKGTGKTSWNR